MAELRVLDAEPPGEGVLELLDHLKEKATAGEYSSIAVAIVYRDGLTGKLWSKVPSVSTLIGAVARLEAALIRTADCE